MNPEDIARAEERIKARAAKIAYRRTERIKESDKQTVMFHLVKDYIILGARMMQEELLNLNSDETQEITH